MGRGFRMPGRPDPEREVQEELEFHLAMRTRELEERGLSPGAARGKAEKEFGDLEGTLRYCRQEDRRRGRSRRSKLFFRSMADEMTLALRSLGRRPAAVVAPLAILTLAVALNALVLSVVRGVLLSPLPFADAERVVVVQEVQDGGGMQRAAYPIVDAWRRQARSTEAMAAYMDTPFPLQTRAGPIHAEGAVVTAGFFGLFSDPLLRGRSFAENEHRAGAAPVAMISQGLWMRAFGGDAGILGRRLELEGRDYTVVGVVRDEAVFPDGTEVWLPVEQASPQLLDVAGAKIFVALALVRPGVSLEEVGVELGGISAGIVGGAPAAAAVTLEERLLGDVRGPLLLLQVAGALASDVPARRAAKLDPANVLKEG